MTTATKPQLEIERKFRLEVMPPLHVYDNYAAGDGAMIGKGDYNHSDQIPLVSIDQAYLVITPEREVRIRNQGGRYILTVKTGEGLCRGEVNTRITQENFEDLLPITIGRVINKHRFLIRNNGYVLELDQYYRQLDGLVILECEFASLEAAADFHLPDWANTAQEVTDDKRYKNKNLALIQNLSSLLDEHRIK